LLSENDGGHPSQSPRQGNVGSLQSPRRKRRDLQTSQRLFEPLSHRRSTIWIILFCEILSLPQNMVVLGSVLNVAK
jgi:hypothetical protein